MTSWPSSPLLPTWISEELTIYFIARYGFENGGRPARLISRTRVLALLARPPRLAHELSWLRTARFVGEPPSKHSRKVR